MKLFKWIKKIGKIVVAAGVSLVINSLLKDNISTQKGFYKKMLLKVGIAAIAGYTVKKVTDSFEDDVDDLEKETIVMVKEFKEIDEISEEA